MKEKPEMYTGFKIRVEPTKEQEAQIWKTIRAVRWTWNWGLEFQMKRRENNEGILGVFDLKKIFTSVRNDENNAWLREVSRGSCEKVLFDLDEAYSNFFEKQKSGVIYTQKAKERANRKGKPLTEYNKNGHPKFKSRTFAKPCVPFANSKMYFTDSKVHLPKIGKLSFMSQLDLPKGNGACKFYDPRLAYENGKWILTLKMADEAVKRELNDYCAGVDLGITTLATISCDEQMHTVPNINKTDSIKRLEKCLKREQRKAARRVKGSSNQKKSYDKIRKLHARIKNIRKNHIHHTTHGIISELPKAIGIEDLNVSGMMKNRCLSKAVQGCNFREIRRQLEYKAKKNGIKITVAGRFYPSSKKCSQCGHIHKNLKLKDRIYICENCGLTIDRDFNAALNLEQLANLDT